VDPSIPYLFFNKSQQKLIFVPEDDNDDSDSDNDEQPYDESKENEDDDDDSAVHDDHDEASASSSSSDENDSAAAAHAAAIGHSPQPMPLKMVDGTSPESNKTTDESPSKESSSKNQNELIEEESPEGKMSSSSPLTAEKTKHDDDHDVEKNIADDDAVVGGIPSNGTSNDSMDVDDDTRPATEEDDDDEEEEEHVEKTHRSPDGSPRQKKHKAKKEKKQKYYCPHNLNERDEDENTPIHVAVHCQKLEHVKLLIEAGASLIRKSDGSPPLHVAISLGAISQHAEFAYECVKVLHENEADFTAKDDAQHTPLFLACMYNLPNIANFILSTEGGLSTLNARADRTQGRALHAAAKFDTVVSANRTAAAAAGRTRVAHLHHPDGSLVNAMHRIPGFPGKQADTSAHNLPAPTTKNSPLSDKSVTEILVKTDGIELNAQNSVGQTPLHVACARGNWNVARLLLDAGASPDIADRRGFTPGQHAHKRGMLIPNDLTSTLGGPPSSGVIPPPRDLIVDPDNNTLLITHELCMLHRTCPPIRRDSTDEPPPENVRRLHVLVDKETGILRTGEFSRCNFENEGRRAALVDVLKVRLRYYIYRERVFCIS
ncbi:MAG: ankyrin repeat protein, partial [Bacillariaceae sp.]|jgi:ankyrin repeat protein